MRALLQRVKKAAVETAGAPRAEITAGYAVLLGVGEGDTEHDAEFLADRTATLRVFSNAAGKFDLSLLDVKGAALVVSQFTLYADTRRGRRPDFTGAAKPAEAARLYAYFVKCLREKGIEVKTGVFAADMTVEIVNDGPVTIWLDSKERMKDEG